ncbi:branched-chain amino acid ABC transporter permease [Sediminicoccus rosea]|jgi:branched-chain amino acid transport system permease protein|uniref:Branched-chain amino acid ABC transporter permease n=1 Tax=Sediminicoccus rosea TaxID=1225128 RepID=A0ABZ0PK25_9PROT|nr:branched-chain amino acid ABC transporter permease [Sediminicoccus rosea]WPB85982.1 branched-chain amino acid ABC transporter permease [Sediminicoccus rosea]
MDPLALFTLQTLNALSLSALLFFISLGLTLIFGIMRVVNFAHGALFMLGAYVGVATQTATGSFALSLVAAPLAAALLGLAFERSALSRLYAREHSAFLLVTFGLALALTEAIRLIWGADARQAELPQALAGIVWVMDEPFPVYRLVLIGAGLLCALLCWAGLQRTRLGLLLRAASQNATMTAALGNDVGRVRALVFALACGLAALGGALAAPLLSASLGLGSNVIIDAFVIVMIGGMGSFIGTAAGSLLVGFVQTFGNFYVPELALGMTYALMIAVLVLRPGGLFGRSE